MPDGQITPPTKRQEPPDCGHGYANSAMCDKCNPPPKTPVER